jgi:O-glycosyl hydrolase
MQRLPVDRSDKLTDQQAAQNIMLSAYTDDKEKVVVVAINYTASEKFVKLDLPNASKSLKLKKYITSALEGDNLKFYPIQKLNDEVVLPARSVVTMVID